MTRLDGPKPTRRADLLLVTVNPHETQAVLRVFEEATGRAPQSVTIEDRVYRDLGTVNGTRVFHALSEMGSAGPGATQQTVEKGIRALRPGAVIAVGIAFGVNEDKQAIGDILLSTQLQLYDLQRVGAEIIPRGDKPHASSRLINFFVSSAQASWQGSKVRPGVILSGDKLVDNRDYRAQLNAFEREAVGGEMEGAGLYVSSNDQKVDWIVIKAICDWADGQKSKNKTARQKKASQNAAQFLLHALKQASLASSARSAQGPGNKRHKPGPAHSHGARSREPGPRVPRPEPSRSYESIGRIRDAAGPLDTVFRATSIRRRVVVTRPDADCEVSEDLHNTGSTPQSELTRVVVSDTPVDFRDLRFQAALQFGKETFPAAVTLARTRQDGRTFTVRIGFRGKVARPGDALTLTLRFRVPGAVARREDYWVFNCQSAYDVPNVVCEGAFTHEPEDVGFFRVLEGEKREPVDLERVEETTTAGQKLLVFRAQVGRPGVYLITWRLDDA